MTIPPENDNDWNSEFALAWESEIADEEFKECWNELIFPDYEMGITLVWVDEDTFEKLPIKVYNAIEKVIYPAMAKRANHFGENKVFATRSWGEYNHLREIRKNVNYEHRVFALVNILYRWHYWNWRFEKSDDKSVSFRSEEGQSLLQTKVNDAVDDVI